MHRVSTNQASSTIHFSLLVYPSSSQLSLSPLVPCWKQKDPLFLLSRWNSISDAKQAHFPTLLLLISLILFRSTRSAAVAASSPHPFYKNTSSGPQHPLLCAHLHTKIDLYDMAMDTSYLTTQVTTIVGQLHGIFDEIGVPSQERESRETEVGHQNTPSLYLRWS